MEQLCNRVVQVGRFGGPDGLEVVAAALPIAGRGEVRVRVQRGGHSEPMRVLHRRRHARRGCRLVLEDVSFDVPPGVCVGIVGPTGAGKTTLLGLLPRFYDPGEGAIHRPSASASATWCSRSRTAGWSPPPRRKEP